MRAVLVLGVVVIGMLIAGWITFHRTDGKATVTIETQKIEDDTTRLMEQGKQALDGATDRLKNRPPASTPPAPGPTEGEERLVPL